GQGFLPVPGAARSAIHQEEGHGRHGNHDRDDPQHSPEGVIQHPPASLARLMVNQHNIRPTIGILWVGRRLRYFKLSVEALIGFLLTGGYDASWQAEAGFGPARLVERVN